MRLLLVEDDETMLHQMRLLLSGEFEIAGTAHDGEEMIQAAERLSPDVILADINMPQMDGIEATRQLLSSHPEALVVLYTMHCEPDVVQRALEAGVRGYVYKLQAGEDVIDGLRSVMRGEIFVSACCLSDTAHKNSG
jgi:DNA-binding NarL/FixJ family response regulator